MGRFLRAVPAILAASLPLCWPIAALSATAGGWKYAANGGTFERPTLTKSNAPGLIFDLMPDGSVKASHPLRASIPGFSAAATAGIVARQLVPWASAALLFGEVVAGSLSEGVLKDLADLIRCRTAGGTAAECDAGQNETSSQQYCYTLPAQYGPGACPNGGWTAQAGANKIAQHELAGCNDIQAPFGGYCTGSSSGVVTGQKPAQGGLFTSATRSTCNAQNVCANPQTFTYGGYGGSLQSVSQCPVITLGGIQVVPVKGPDGKCATGIYSPHSSSQIRDKLTSFPSVQTQAKDLADDIVKNRYDAGADLSPSADDPIVEGPSSITGTPTTTTTTTGTDAPVTTTTTPGATITYNGPSYTWQSTTTTTTGDTTTTTTNTPTQKIETCGLPGTPSCKIDETGTPEGEDKNPQAEVDAAKADAKAVADGNLSRFPTMPTISWSFALPSGCGAIPTPAFAPFISQVDICPFLPTFHLIMGVVWMLGGLFGARELFFRDVLNTH